MLPCRPSSQSEPCAFAARSLGPALSRGRSLILLGDPGRTPMPECRRSRRRCLISVACRSSVVCGCADTERGRSERVGARRGGPVHSTWGPSGPCVSMRRMGARRPSRLVPACRGVAQLVEHRSPKPAVAGSSPVAPADVARQDARQRWTESPADGGQRHPRGERVTQTRTEAPSARTASAGRGGRIGRFLREVISELRKVLWPSRQRAGHLHHRGDRLRRGHGAPSWPAWTSDSPSSCSRCSASPEPAHL